MIDQVTIDRIIDAADIVEVIEEFISLKRRGANFLGHCPFHNEKTPSFTVSPSKRIFKCFGCGKGGNAVHFIMEHEQLSYPEALKYLAKKYNIEIEEKELTEEEVQRNHDRESMLIISSYAQKYFSDQMYNSRDGKAIAHSYFIERGFREDIIQKFQLGYCPQGRDTFSKQALSKGYKLDFLEKTGLTIVKEKDRYYDRFNGRVIFPIHSISGQVIGFGGRILKTDAKAAKYLNSPESEIYHKSKVLYGLYFAKKKIIQQDKCYLVEGYTDVISLYQSGIENVVASSGTSLTVEQIRLIKRFTKNITILYDGDEAGIKASLRGIDLILEEGMNVKILLFPEGEDPDSFSKQHSSAEFLEYIINNEQDFINFKTRLLLTSASSDPIKKAGVITDLVKTISVIPDHITRTIYIKECSKQLEIEEQILYTEISKRKRKKADQNYKKKNELLRKKQETTPNKPSNTKDFEIEEREIIRLLLKYGNQILFPEDNNNVDPDDCPLVYEYIIAELEADNIEFKTPVFRLIYNNYKEKLSEGNSIAIKQFINHPNPEIGKISADLLSNKYILSKFFTDKGSRVETEEMKLNLLVPKAIVEYKHRIINTHLDNIKNEIKEAQRTQNNDELINLQQKYHQLYQINIALAQKLGGRIILD